jgi:hypothetical protein
LLRMLRAYLEVHNGNLARAEEMIRENAAL